MRHFFFTTISFFVLQHHAAFAQGCSDAGFCTIGALGHMSHTEIKATRHTLKLALPVGLGDENVTVFTPALEYTLQRKDWQWQGKITGNYASGNLGSVWGAGDVVLSGTYSPPTEKPWKPSFTLGTKLPLNQSNLKVDGRSLPMQYQSSLGTVDVIAGVALSSARWTWAAGWQQPLSGRNRNNFLPVYWTDGKAAAYPPTNDFNRKGDVLLRTAYAFVKQATLQLEGGVLGIYHLGKDTYVDVNRSLSPIAIKGSQGLTLNLTAAGNLQLNKAWTVGITAGVPLVVRDVRPDGLTRRFIVAPQLLYHF